MNVHLLGPELVLALAGLAMLLADLIVPPERRRGLGYAAAALVAVLFLYTASSKPDAGEAALAFGGMFVLDGLALYFKSLFLLAGVVVLVLAAETIDRVSGALTEYFALTLFALSGMLLAASANDFAVLYVALELVTVSFYVLTSFQQSRVASLEAGVKYLILGALSSAILVYGIALCFGSAGTTSFSAMAAKSEVLAESRLFQAGMLMVFAGLAFKLAVFPFQIWAPDVYEGSPTATTAFLAVGSKAVGVVLLVRLLGEVVTDLALRWESLLMAVAGISILYGSLCAIPQRGLKRLLGYSSIANGGFVVIGLSAVSKAGSAAVLFYLAGYLFTVLAAFLVVSVITERLGSDDISGLAGLHRRSPFLAAALSLAMISLAGVPPLAGFFGKFLVLKAVVEQGGSSASSFWIVGVAILGVVISFWYYFGVVRAIYWSDRPAETAPLTVAPGVQAVLALCLLGVVLLGILPATVWDAALAAVGTLKL